MNPLSPLNRLLHDERGSVLMEFLMVVPMYLTLLGGLVWVGELGLVRQKNVVAERYVAYNIANRYRNATTDELLAEVDAKFFADIENRSVALAQAGFEEVGVWKRTGNARIESEVGALSGIIGMLRIGEVFGNNPNPPPLTMTVAGSLGGHTVLMRGEKKYELDEAGDISWQEVLDDVWWP